MITVVGLGNPGEEYALTRHNAGRIILEQLATKYDFFDWKNDLKTKTLITKGGIEGTKMQFLLPNNFMNNSGHSVAPVIKTKKPARPDEVGRSGGDLAQLVVVYDDLDIPLGKIKVSFNRSSGGHNGVESIIKQLGSKEFVRIRVGVSPHTPTGKLKKPSGEKAVIDFLMKNFKEKELTELKKMSVKVGEALLLFAEKGKDIMMTECNA